MKMLVIFFWIVGIFLVFQIVARIICKLFPGPIPHWAAFGLERNPIRNGFWPPAKMLDRFGIEPGMRVLEVGPGGGYFTIEAAKRVGDKGKLCAIDIQPQMIAKTKKKVEQSGLANIELEVADAVDLPFEEEYFHLVFMSGVLGEIPDQKAALREFHKVIRPGGILSITEAFPDGHYILKSNLIKRCRILGFVPFEEYGGFYTYTVNFRKPNNVGGEG